MVRGLIESGREAQRTGAWDQALAHFDAALQMLPPGEQGTRADLLRWIGTVQAERGDVEAAWHSFSSSREIAEEAALREQESSALVSLAGVEVLRGKLELAADLFLQARGMAEVAGQERLLALIDMNLGIIANIQGNVPMALLSYRSSLDRYRRLQDDFSATRALMNMGMAHADLAEWEASERCFAEAAALAQQTGDSVMIGRVELNRAELHLKHRRFDEARKSVDRSLEIFHRLRTRSAIGEAYKLFGMLYRETGRPEQSDTHFALSLGMAETCENRLLQAEVQMEWALLHLEEGRGQEGVMYLNRSLQLFRELKAGREVLDIERRLERLKELYLPAVSSWGARLAEGKDPFQSGHAKRVAEYATRLGREVGLSGWDLTWLQIGAYIHDLGNMAVPGEVQGKVDELDTSERELMKVHTIMGDSLARQLDFPEEVRPMVRNHHEHWAGTGYPDRLMGEEIPLSARIVTIADVFDALTSPRSFRSAYSRDEALGVMRRDSARIFDRQLFNVFEEMVRAEPVQG